jgi:uncharacterized membrane protein YfcA
MAGINPTNALLLVLSIVTVLYLVLVGARVRKATQTGEMALVEVVNSPRAWGRLGTGFVTNFFDTLGIGSYATTTAIFRKFGLVVDEQIPGTLNIGHTPSTIVQAFLFTKLVPIDPVTLVLMIVAAVAGSYIGSGVVAKLPRRAIQVAMGVALVVAALLMTLALFNVGPGGGDALRLEGSKLVIAVVANFILGSFMTIGIGLYGPCQVLIYFLGMAPTAAFPIMMGSCAFLMPTASARFINTHSFDLRATLGLMLGGIPAVFLAFTVFSNMNMTYIKVLVVVIVLYTAFGLLRSALAERKDEIVMNPALDA